MTADGFSKQHSSEYLHTVNEINRPFVSLPRFASAGKARTKRNWNSKASGCNAHLIAAIPAPLLQPQSIGVALTLTNGFHVNLQSSPEVFPGTVYLTVNESTGKYTSDSLLRWSV